ncbi:YqgE/AlgH family protein [Verrucomicrobiales bacterium]|nr:YqgE/AlgH family protein [Verrucomicrobiales bacterium]
MEHSLFRIANAKILEENEFSLQSNVIFIVSDSLQGNLILAVPQLKEPPFFQSVLLLTEHNDENGALGYILNRPIGRVVGDLLSEQALPPEQRNPLKDVPVFMGGPVNQEHLTFSALGWSEVDEKLQFSTHLSAAEAVMYEMEGFHIRAFVGYSGWEVGQLEDELESKSWITHEPNREVIDLSKVDGLWKDMLRDLNPYYRLVADEPDDLSLN